ncbi:hypothetical protein L2E82_45996 [Cichorium intybus]|uniref:Uncharacterized protein n=1 Tax=Cichorium intybus TaxID=13427 RepID=A0ACB8ZU36_CICIN|nr:hypothetical protein L2E82_45996 [Cichorium intybus]
MKRREGFFVFLYINVEFFLSGTSISVENPEHHIGESPTVQSLSHKLLLGVPAEVVVVVHREGESDSTVKSDGRETLFSSGSTVKSRNDFLSVFATPVLTTNLLGTASLGVEDVNIPFSHQGR